MYECFHCGQMAVIWDCDYDGDDYGEIRPCIIQELHCSNCGAIITYRIYLDEEEK